MASDYDWSLPAWEAPPVQYAPMQMQDFESNAFWKPEQKTPQKFAPMQAQDFEESSFWNTTSNPEESSELWGNLWDWAGSDMGTSVLGGAVVGGLNMWGQERAYDRQDELSEQNRAALLAESALDRESKEKMFFAGLDAKKAEAGEKIAQKRRHNASFSKSMPMNVRKFKK